MKRSEEFERAMHYFEMSPYQNETLDTSFLSEAENILLDGRLEDEVEKLMEKIRKDRIATAERLGLATEEYDQMLRESAKRVAPAFKEDIFDENSPYAVASEQMLQEEMNREEPFDWFEKEGEDKRRTTYKKHEAYWHIR